MWGWGYGDRDRTTALWGYIKLRLEFPQTFPEARTGVTINGLYIPPKHTFAQVPNVAPTTLAEYRLQSAALLYLIMSERGGRGMTFSSDDVTNGDVTIASAFSTAAGTRLVDVTITAFDTATTSGVTRRTMRVADGMSSAT